MASRRRLAPVGSQTTTMVDSCVLLDVLTGDPKWADWSEHQLVTARDTGSLVLNPLVYAEVSTGFDQIEDLDAALPAGEFVRDELPYEAGFLAGKAFLKYRKRGGKRRSPLPDFYIGAHAAVRGYRLLTRDTSRYETYFPTVELIKP